MVSLIPVGILIVLAVLLQLLGRFRFSIGRTWLLAAVTSFSVWALMIVLRYLNPSGLLIENWLSLPVKSINLSFSFSPETWIFGFLATTLLLVGIFADARFIEQPGYLNKITRSVLFTAFGLLAITSGNWVSLALTWGILDLTEFIFQVIDCNDKRAHKREILLFLTKSIGIILLIGVMVTTQRQADPTKYLGIWLIIVLITFLRSGVLVTGYLDTKLKDNQRGSWLILRMIPFLSVFPLFGMIDISLLSKGISAPLTTFLAIGILLCATFWFLSKNAFKGSPYWLAGALILSIICVFIGQTSSLKTIAIFGTLGSGGLYLNSFRFRKQNLFVALLLIGLFGIPFTPTSPLRAGLAGGDNDALLFLLIPSLAFFIGGIVRHSLQKEQPHGKPEAWIDFVYYVALFIFLISPWITILFYFDEIRIIENWWISIAILGFTFLVVLPYTPIGIFFGKNLSFVNTIRHQFFPVIHFVESENRFTWFGKILDSIQRFLAIVINLSIRVLEGDGGILWSIFFLVLLVSLIRSLGIP